MSHPWRDESVLSDFRDRGLTYPEIADELECHRRTVAEWMARHGLNEFQSSDEDVYFFTGGKGYEQLHDVEGTGTFRHHQLLSIANGADPFEVFSDGKFETHHFIDIPWLNVPGNVETVDRARHRRIHTDGGRVPPEAVLGR